MSSDPVGTFLYFSDLLSRTVVDAAGKPIGKLWDLSIQLPEPFPNIRQLFIRPPGQADLLLVAEGSQVRSWTESPIPLTARVPDLRPSRRREVAEIRLREALLDKQVVDVSGAKVERVNDLHFLVAREGPRARAHRRRPARPRPAAGLGARGRGRRPPGSSARALPRRRGGPHRLEVRRADARRPGGPSPRALDEVDREPAPGRPRRDPRGPAARVPALGLRRPGVPDRRARAARGGFEDAAGAAHGRERPRARCGPAREDAARRRRRRPLRDAGGGGAGPDRPDAARRRARGRRRCSSTKRTRPAA